MPDADKGTMKCTKCGTKLEMETYWYGEVLQLLWYCNPCKCGFVRDVYFTKEGTPSPFSDANLRVEQAIGDLLEEQVLATAEELPTLGDAIEDYDHPRLTSQLLEGCPTDEELQLMRDTAEEERLEEQAWYEKHWKLIPPQRKKGRGYD